MLSSSLYFSESPDPLLNPSSLNNVRTGKNVSSYHSTTALIKARMHKLIQQITV